MKLIFDSLFAIKFVVAFCIIALDMSHIGTFT